MSDEKSEGKLSKVVGILVCIAIAAGWCLYGYYCFTGELFSTVARLGVDITFLTKVWAGGVVVLVILAMLNHGKEKRVKTTILSYLFDITVTTLLFFVILFPVFAGIEVAHYLNNL